MITRVVHTSDWHLGHTLHDVSRDAEHEAFLALLLDTLQSREADVLLIAGDIFDTANPPASAQRIWYSFLARLRERLPDLDVVVIGGNHDSAARLDAPNPLLEEMRIAVVGGMPRKESGELDIERLVVEVGRRRGGPGLQVLAVPFLRPADLPVVEGDPLVGGVAEVYRRALQIAEDRRQPGQCIVAMGHLFLADTKSSQDSERPILGGNQHPIPASIFPASIDYVALGHLHLDQTVGSKSVRYSGSPIPLSLTERNYNHSFWVIELEAGQDPKQSFVPIPHLRKLLRFPEIGAAALGEALAWIGTLPPAADPASTPLLELVISLPQRDPTLRKQVEEALAGRHARLVKLNTQPPTTPKGLSQSHTQSRTLNDLKPEEVLRAMWSQRDQGELPDPVLNAFRDLLVKAAHSEAG